MKHMGFWNELAQMPTAKDQITIDETESRFCYYLNNLFSTLLAEKSLADVIFTSYKHI